MLSSSMLDWNYNKEISYLTGAKITILPYVVVVMENTQGAVLSPMILY